MSTQLLCVETILRFNAAQRTVMCWNYC